jgi:aminomethyltransferase
MNPELKDWLELRAQFLSRVRRVLIEELHVQRAPEEIDPDAPLFGTGLGLDSVDAVELVVSLETEFGFRLDDEHLARAAMRTVNSLVDLVMRRAGQSSSGPGVEPVPAAPVGELEPGLKALRTATALCEAPVAHVLRLTGKDAFATLDRLCTAPLNLQDTQLRPGLFLRDDATVFADVYVARDDETYLLLAEGPALGALLQWVEQHRAGPELKVERFDSSRRAFSLHGPWAWDLLASVLGPDVIGMPYLTLMRGEGGLLCFRTGKTGEYGYELLVPNDGAAALLESVKTQGKAWELAPVTQETLDLCALENWFFDIRHEAGAGLTPLELGLQWRVSPKKQDFVGAAAYLAHKASGSRQRVSCLVAEGAVRAGDTVTLAGEAVGRVVHAARSPLLGRSVAMALLNVAVAVPGVGQLEVGGQRARTVAPPVLNNRSLHVSPQRHSWAEREAAKFPPLA